MPEDPPREVGDDADHGGGSPVEDFGQPHASHDVDDAPDAQAEESAARGGALPRDRAGEQGASWWGDERNDQSYHATLIFTLSTTLSNDTDRP